MVPEESTHELVDSIEIDEVDTIDDILDDECEAQMKDRMKEHAAIDKMIGETDLKTIETVAKKLEAANIAVVQNSHLFKHECQVMTIVEGLTCFARQLRVGAAKAQMK